MCLFIHNGPSCCPQFGAVTSMLLFIFLYVSLGTQRNTFLLGIYRGVELLVVGYVCIQCQLLFSCWVVSYSGPQGPQHARPPCPSLFPRVCSNSCPFCWWYHPTISSSVAPFSSCSQSFPESRPFPVSWLLASGGGSPGASASASVLQCLELISITINWFDLLAVQSCPQHHNSKTSILQC